MSEKARTLRSGELARAAGVSTDTLRHYERVGVLPRAPRNQSGYRSYPAGSLERVQLVQHAIGLGFTLAELAEILRARDRGAAPCKRVLGLLEDKLGSLERKINDLVGLRQYMQTIVDDWRSRVEQGEAGKRVHLLHSLSAGHAPVATDGNLRRRRTQR